MRALTSLKQAFDAAAIAHLVVDVQDVYCNPNNARVRDRKRNVSTHHDVALRIADFVQRTRPWLTPVWIVHAVKTRGAMLEEATYDLPRHFCQQSLYGGQQTWTSDPMIKKTKFDSFDGTRLEHVLREKNIHDVLISGVVLSQCVTETALSAQSAGFNVFIVEDQVADGAMGLAKKRTYIDELGCNRVSAQDIISMADAKSRAPALRLEASLL